MSKLFTLPEMHSRLPKDCKMSFSAFEELIEEHGTYHAFGKYKLMTERDYEDLLRLTAQRHRRPNKPSPNEPGLMCFIGHQYDPQSLLFIGWSPLGQELELLDRIREGAQEFIQLVNTVHATPAEVERFKLAHKKAWRHGGWFGKTDELVEAMRTRRDFEDEVDEEGEGIVGRESEVQAEA